MRQLFLACIVFAFTSIAYASDDIEAIYTEEYPPFNYSEGGEIKGNATEFVVEILAQLNSTLKREDIRLVPWARGYIKTQQVKNAMLYSVARTKEREDQFKWVCPVGYAEIALFARKDRFIEINKISDLSAYRTGVVRGDIGHHLLKEEIHISQLDVSNSSEANIMKLRAGRIDIFAYAKNVAFEMLEKNGFDPKHFESIFSLEKVPFCLAFNKETSTEFVSKVQKILDGILEGRQGKLHSL